MRHENSSIRLSAIWSAFLLAGLCLPMAAWADGGSYQRVYSDQYQTSSSSYPQYFPRIEPDSTYQAQPQPQYSAPRYSHYGADPTYSPPLQASVAAHPPKTISDKISDGFHDLWKSPSLKSGIAGAGIGLGAAAVTKEALWHGTWVGAAYGAGIGLMDESYFFKRHPFVRRSGKGALIGLGAATVTGAAALGPAAAVGAGIGAGIHYLKTH